MQLRVRNHAARWRVRQVQRSRGAVRACRDDDVVAIVKQVAAGGAGAAVPDCILTTVPIHHLVAVVRVEKGVGNGRVVDGLGVRVVPRIHAVRDLQAVRVGRAAAGGAARREAGDGGGGQHVVVDLEGRDGAVDDVGRAVAAEGAAIRDGAVQEGHKALRQVQVVRVRNLAVQEEGGARAAGVDGDGDVAPGAVALRPVVGHSVVGAVQVVIGRAAQIVGAAVRVQLVGSLQARRRHTASVSSTR